MGSCAQTYEVTRRVQAAAGGKRVWRAMVGDDEDNDDDDNGVDDNKRQECDLEEEAVERE